MKLFLSLLVVIALLIYALGTFIDSVADQIPQGRNWPVSRTR